MTVRVYDHQGGDTGYDADSVDTDGATLWVKKGAEIVAVYAPGKWINADIKTSE